LAEDHKVLRRTLAEYLQEERDLVVVAEAGDGWEALALAKTVRPDVVLMDFSMPGLDGGEATREIRAQVPEVRVIGFSMHDSDYMSAKMRSAGVAAYVSKADPPDRVIEVIRSVFRNS